MSDLPAPATREVLLSLALLLASYVAARFLSWILGKAVRGGARGVDEQLLAALKHPVTYSLFLVGAYAAVQRLTLPPAWSRRLDSVLFVFGVLLLTLALVRSYAIVLDWYTRRPHVLTALAVEFAPLFSVAGRVFIGLVALITILQYFGVNVASLVVSLGVGSLAVGLAAQDTLANMFAGFTLMLDRPFRVGDRIQLASGEVGDVESIGIRATLIKTLEDTILVVPNSVLVKERLVNQSRPVRYLTTRVEVAVPYGTDIDRLKKLLADAVVDLEHADPERPPQVLLTRFGEFAVTLQVVFWARDFSKQGLARSQAHEAVYRALVQAGIEAPVPTRILREGVKA